MSSAESNPNPPSARIVTLGCAKNDVDSEEIAGVLAEGGYDLTAQSRADVVIINTCGFLEASKQESIQAIRDAVKQKEAGLVKKVIVAGCLAQRLGMDMAKFAPGADAYIGVGQMARFREIAAQVRQSDQTLFDITPPHHRWADITTRARTGKPWSAYLKVSEGCDHKCTFCTIPSFRGHHQSKPMERVLAEAHHLARTGAKEINLIAQDVTQYGFDLYKEFTLPRLLNELNHIDGIEWIRILYFYPNRLTDEVIDAMATCEKVAPYIDIPLQHSHPDVLARMKRPWDGDRYLKLFDKVRARIPDVAIRSTFIIGFPGETEAEFEDLVCFVNAAKLDRVGAFLFSREEPTPSYNMEGQVPHRVKEARFARLMETQKEISRQVNQSWVGKELKVLVEEHREGWSIGRSHRDAPDIDGLVFLPALHEKGRILRARVTSADDYDLTAEAISRFAGQDLPSLQNTAGANRDGSNSAENAAAPAARSSLRPLRQSTPRPAQ